MIFARVAETIDRIPLEEFKRSAELRSLLRSADRSVRLVVESQLGVRIGPDADLRRRAEELRAIADQYEIPSIQQSLQEAAASFDRLADEADAELARRSDPETSVTR